MRTLKVKKMRENAIIPIRKTKGSAGYDLFACLDSPVTIEPRETTMIPFGIAIAIPSEKYCGLIFARSSLGTYKGIIPGNCVGVIDSDYRGELMVGLHNYSDEPFTVRHGDRIAQLVITEIAIPYLDEVSAIDNTERGAGGFGSTGLEYEE